MHARSQGLFKPSTVASYELGARQISLERLFGLAEIYGVAPERLVGEIAARLKPGSRRTRWGGSVVALPAEEESHRTR